MGEMVPDIAQLEQATVALLSKARKDDGLNDLTVRKVRQILEEQFSLQPGTLEAKEFKTVIKDIIVTKLSGSKDQESTRDAQPSKQTNSEVSPRTKKSTRKRDKKEPKGANKGKLKGKVVESSADELETAPEQPSSRKASSSPPKTKSAKDKSKEPKPSKASKPESSKFKSRAVIESSEDEDEEEAQRPTSSLRAKKEAKPVKASLPKPDKNASPTKVTANIDAVVESNGNQNTVASTSTLVGSSSSSKKAVVGDGAESDLSSVIDEPPKKRQKKEKGAEKPGESQKPGRGKKTKEPLSKDEETVTKLKAIIVACGVRKAWKREFQGLEALKQQIKRLHEILAELGMKPRYTLEKAKAIKRKREFQQELQDVQEFERAQRKRDRTGQESGSENASDQSSESELGAPVKRRVGHIHSI
ncbi:hypothetical protein V8B97DRAFT_1954714 [Scleroderma yunnanense]